MQPRCGLAQIPNPLRVSPDVLVRTPLQLSSANAQLSLTPQKLYASARLPPFVSAPAHQHYAASRIPNLSHTNTPPRAPASSPQERLIGEWKRLKTSGTALRLAVGQSRLEYIARWESLEPTRDAIAAGRWARGVTPISIHPCTGTALPRSRSSFSVEMEVSTCAPTTTPKHFEFLSLFALHRFPTLVLSLPRTLAGTCSSHGPHTPTLPAAYPHCLNSRAAPSAAPSTRLPASARFGWGGAWSRWARSLSYPYRTRACSFSCVCPRTPYSRARHGVPALLPLPPSKHAPVS
ncbi:hypothetical protein C8F04DRAFT_1397598 [Mycena alexandri]|uniref:Uncharacterized protein n=1 Tax=Mycena alexandri TaxID=1745969 RepID=A0AAD6X124_9AGAR|nr:hypothetical protein C8F04DRAFT_1397598 [Mycena alexandri]